MRERTLNAIESLIKVGETKEGFVKIIFMSEAHGMAMLGNEIGIISKKELEMITKITIERILEVNHL